MADAVIGIDVASPLPRGAERTTAVPKGQRRTVLLAVENMHCGGCMRKVETALLAVPNVLEARTNLSARRVSITTQGQQATVEPFIAALEAVGFKATALDSGQQIGRAHV